MIGNVAIVTGAAKGLGKEFCRLLLNRGAKVCIADLDVTAGKEALAEFNTLGKGDDAFFVKCDVTKEDDLSGIFKETKRRFGSIDIVCNNAGIVHENKWRSCVDVNLNAVIRGSQLALEHMAVTSGGKGGVLINVASMAGLMSFPQAPVYAATKHAVVGYTRSIAMEYAVHRVRTNILCPGFTATDILIPVEGALSDLQLEGLEQTVNLFGVQSIDIVGEAFMKLIDDESKNCTVMQVEPLEGIKEVEYPDLAFFPNAKLSA